MAGLWQKRAELSQNETEHWKARAENGNHQIILLCKTFGLGCATLKNGYSVTVRENAAHPGERTPRIINAGECFVYYSTSTLMHGDTPKTFFKLADGAPTLRKQRQLKSFHLPRHQPLKSKTFHSTTT